MPGSLLPGVTAEQLASEIASLRSRLDLLALSAATDVGTAVSDGNRRAFMVMPFGPEDLQIVYEDFIQPTLERTCGLSCIRGDDIFGSNVIMDDVEAAISESDIVVADLTGRNPNVFYEIGIAHALRKPVLLLAQSLDDIPFDLRHRRVQPYAYTPRGCKLLEKALAEHVRAMLAQAQQSASR